MFNSVRRVLKLEGFPVMLREKAEFIECGSLKNFNTTRLISAVERYCKVEQRWGR